MGGRNPQVDESWLDGTFRLWLSSLIRIRVASGAGAPVPIGWATPGSAWNAIRRPAHAVRNGHRTARKHLSPDEPALETTHAVSCLLATGKLVFGKRKRHLSMRLLWLPVCYFQPEFPNDIEDSVEAGVFVRMRAPSRGFHGAAGTAGSLSWHWRVGRMFV